LGNVINLREIYNAMPNKSLAKNQNRRFCDFDGGEITLETPLLKSSIFVELRVRFTSAVRYRSGLVPRNDKTRRKTFL